MISTEVKLSLITDDMVFQVEYLKESTNNYYLQLKANLERLQGKRSIYKSQLHFCTLEANCKPLACQWGQLTFHFSIGWSLGFLLGYLNVSILYLCSWASWILQRIFSSFSAWRITAWGATVLMAGNFSIQWAYVHLILIFGLEIILSTMPGISRHSFHFPPLEKKIIVC